MTITALNEARGEDWLLINGDNIPVMHGMDPNSIHLTITSIPFLALFTYGASNHDFGNCRTHAEFYEHFRFWVEAMLRITKPGRLCCIHLMTVPTSKTKDGFIGLIDFRGDVIRAMREAGWIYHSEVAIWSDPVVQVTRTKALGLLHRQLKKDSCMSRMGLMDFVCTFRKPGTNDEPVTHTNETFSIPQWQKWASPIWMDIDRGKTLNVRAAREHDDEAHLCALQTEVIERCVHLWSNPGDTLFDPFAGIGSTGFVAVQNERRFCGIELKKSYFQQAVKNLETAKRTQPSLFSNTPTEEPIDDVEANEETAP